MSALRRSGKENKQVRCIRCSHIRRSDAYAGNPIKGILLNLNLPDHRSVLKEPEVHVKMEMAIPRSSKVKFITACSYLIDKYKDMMKAQVHVTQVFRYSDTQKDLP
ncbi:hypothetical protein Tco_0882787 [Tanacetum coccineum]